MAEHYVEFVLRGDPARARATVVQELEGLGFRLSWSDEWTAVAERGSQVANAIVGALAQYFRVGVRIMSVDQGQSILRLDRLTSGWLGGAVGASRTKKQMARLRDDLWKAFYEAGVLVNVGET